MTALLWPLIGLFLLADLILLPPLITRARRKEMGVQARANAPCSFAYLPSGVTHYQWQGPPGGDIIVLVHGLSTPSFVWAGIVPDLTTAGYRVLTYDLFGCGFSDRPFGRQTGAFFSRRLVELLDDQMIRQPITLFGYSMGGAIVNSFAGRYPGRVENLILLASAGFVHKTSGMAAFIRNTPVIGDWMMSVFGAANHRKAALAEDISASVIPDITDLQIRETYYRGYLRSVLSCLRNLLATPLDDLHMALAKHQIPTLAIWGDQDRVIPLASAARLRAANPVVVEHIITGADHGLAYTHPSDVTGVACGFLATANRDK